MSQLALVFAAAARIAAAQDLDRAALADHLRESYNVPAAVEVAFSTPVEAGVPGFKKAAVTFSRGGSSSDETLWISDDGRHYLLGGFKDLKVHPDNDRMAKVALKGVPMRGAKDAKVTVVQYTDFQCPFCQRGYEIMRDRVLKEFPGKVRWFYKALPLTSIHPWAEPAAVAAECAEQQGEDKFWAVHDRLFDAQREISLENLDEKVASYIKEAKGDQAKLAACMDAKRTLPDVARDAAEAESIGISGTPAFLVNGHYISGADYPTIKRVIEESLQGRHGKI